MRRPRSLLVAVRDPAAAPTAALAKAAQLAQAFGADLELLHVIALPVWPELLGSGDGRGADWQRGIRAARLAQLERLAAPLRAQGLAVSCSAIWDHPPHEALIRRARASGADLIIADRHAGREPARWLMQYTDWELLRLAPVPVLMVGAERHYRRPVLLAAVDPGHAHDKPAALDEEIAGSARLLADALAGKVQLVHALQPDMALTMAALYPPVAEALASRVSRRNARLRLTRLARRYRIAAGAVRIREEHPETAIVAAVRESGAAVLVLGSVSRSGLKRLMFGNTAERLIARLRCDLLVVKPRSFRSPVPARRRPVQIMLPPVVGG